MVEKTCRLCLKKATMSIEIFSAEGICLKITEILWIHFPDECFQYFMPHCRSFIPGHCGRDRILFRLSSFFCRD